MMATASAVAFIVFSCKGKLSEAEDMDISQAPVQTVDSIFMTQSDKGVLQMRAVAPRMARYDNDTASFEQFPFGLEVYGYTEEGLLETQILSDEALHFKSKKDKSEFWRAYGNVVVQNIIKQQTMETDTLYWDQANKEIYTDCYVKMYSNDGFMQGYGMRSDEMARNSILYKTFNSYGVVIKDSTKVIIDSVNFIGPLLPDRKTKVVKKKK